MVHEDYLPCSAYEGQDAHATESGYVAFFNEESQRYFFALTDEQGVLLISEGYPQAAARENGIQSVNKNKGNRDFWSVKNEDGKYFLSLRAANYREIARTCTFDSEADALGMLDYVTGEKSRTVVAAVAETVKERANDRDEDNYLACKDYAGQADADADGMVKFTHSDGENYFAWVDADGNVLMRSEGYPTTAARDNGLASVLKNRDLEERWSTMEKHGRYFVILKAGNHQEIARSCPYESEAAAMALYPSSRAAAAEAAAAALAAQTTVVEEKATSEREEDNYLACKDYAGHTGVDADGFVKFTHTDGEHYFTWLDTEGKVLMRSEGYPSTAARDNGMASVLKNRDIEERWSVMERMGRYFAILKAGNHQEIARSCPYDSEAGSRAYFPSSRRSTTNIERSTTTETETVQGETTYITETRTLEPIVRTERVTVEEVIPPPPPVIKEEDKEDDYLICKEYEGHHINDKINNVALFKHANGQFYFALYNANGSVRLRSEGFRTANERDSELSGVLRNLNNKDMYTTIEKGGYHMLVLKDKTGREVGRSCLMKDEPTPIVAPIAAVAAVAAAAPIIEKVVVNTDKEDDYIPCQEYKGHKADANGIAKFTHGGQKYFVWYGADGGVRLRSEGFKTDADLQEELDLVLKHRNDKGRWETIEKAGHRMHILKDPKGREIGRSCLEKIVVAPPVMAAAPPPPIVETPIIETPKAGFNWWWLLIPLLLLLAWWLFKDGCNKAEVPAVKVEAPAPEPVKPEERAVAPVPVGCPSCTGTSTDPIFTSVCDNPKKLSRLGTNPEFGNSHALSPEEFYNKLKKAYANNDVDKAFLDRIYKAMGYTGFADAKADQYSAVTLPVGATGRLGYSKAHKTGCYTLPDEEYHRKAFHIKAANGCDLHFMKTCGNHFFFCAN